MFLPYVLRHEERGDLAVRGHWRLCCYVVVVVLLLAFPAPVSAQRQPKKGQETADPVDVALPTKDGVLIHARYYPGLLDEKENKPVPIMMVHGWKGQGSDFYPLAKMLQDPQYGGHAVIVPDLRGHGRSLTAQPPGAEEAIQLNANRFRRNEISAMVDRDLERVKKFLVERNNDSELNIELLCVVGADLGALLALNFTALDWDWPPVAGMKQGQDVKAAVLISPLQSFKGITSQQAVTTEAVRHHVSLLIVYGENEPKAANMADRIHGGIKRFRRQDWSAEDRLRRQDLFVLRLDTSLQGTELLGEEQLRREVAANIAQFIDVRLTQRRDLYPWALRERPIQ